MEASAILARLSQRLSPREAAITSVVSGLLSISYSFVSTPDYRVPIAAALLFAILHFRATYLCLYTASSRWRWALLAVTAPVEVLFADNVGRLLHNLAQGRESCRRNSRELRERLCDQS